MKKAVFTITLILVCVLPLLANTPPVTDIELLRHEARAKLAISGSRWLELDTNGDGVIDHIMLLNRNGDKIYEEIDTNHSGKIDTLCYYHKGVLVREEIDTTGNGKIDLWVFIREGIYVEKYMRDTTGDGTIDKIKEFGPKKKR